MKPLNFSDFSEEKFFNIEKTTIKKLLWAHDEIFYEYSIDSTIFLENESWINLLRFLVPEISKLEWEFAK